MWSLGWFPPLENSWRSVIFFIFIVHRLFLHLFRVTPFRCSYDCRAGSPCKGTFAQVFVYDLGAGRLGPLYFSSGGFKHQLFLRNFELPVGVGQIWGPPVLSREVSLSSVFHLLAFGGVMKQCLQEMRVEDSTELICFIAWRSERGRGYLFFVEFCLEVRTSTFCQLMGVPSNLKVELLSGKQKASEYSLGSSLRPGIPLSLGFQLSLRASGLLGLYIKSNAASTPM